MIQIQEPLFKPETSWTPPSHYPRMGDIFGFDLETNDPDLTELGPSSIRGGGYPVGLSISRETKEDVYDSFYFPFAHEGGGNMDKGIILRWAKPILEDPNKLLIGHNLLYEIEWCSWMGIEIKCKLWDISVAEALLAEEDRKFSLDAICKKRLGYGKNEDILRQAAALWGFSTKSRKGKPFDAKSDLWRLPAKYVGSYAESDASDPIKVYKIQRALIEEEGLTSICEMEHKLLPVIWAMRRKGVRIDEDRAQQLYKEWNQKEKALYAELRKMVHGVTLDSVWTPTEVAAGATKLGLAFPRTPKTNEPSFVDAWLSSQEHPYWKQVSDIRGVNKLNDSFLRKSILENMVGGRIHCQFHPMQREEGGTRSGRLSCSNPNLQQAPNLEHSDEAWKLRAVLLPELGEVWGKLDYSQQEPRLVVHYGCIERLRGAEEARMEYEVNSKADFYLILVKLANITRSEAKKLYLGRSYGMGKDKLARSLGISVEEAVEIGAKMDAAVPFIKALYKGCSDKAKNRGWIRTILGRKAHFDLWEPSNWENSNGFALPCSLERAKKQWGDIALQRSGTHKAMNRLIQGSAADMTKRAMLNLYAEGILPMLQVHDELDISFADPKIAMRAKEIMETAIELKVPIYADLKTGPNWGEAE
jgi:DNA polymerase I-like protein with 3'-5' exonuclease and polymerase domains